MEDICLKVFRYSYAQIRFNGVNKERILNSIFWQTGININKIRKYFNILIDTGYYKRIRNGRKVLFYATFKARWMAWQQFKTETWYACHNSL